MNKIRGHRWIVPQFRECGGSVQENSKSRKIIQENRTSDYSLVVSDLTKIYPANNFMAVDQLSFSVDKREFFGLLGVNGNYLLILNYLFIIIIIN